MEPNKHRPNLNLDVIEKKENRLNEIKEESSQPPTP